MAVVLSLSINLVMPTTLMRLSSCVPGNTVKKKEPLNHHKSICPLSLSLLRTIVANPPNRQPRIRTELPLLLFWKSSLVLRSCQYSAQAAFLDQVGWSNAYGTHALPFPEQRRRHPRPRRYRTSWPARARPGCDECRLLQAGYRSDRGKRDAITAGAGRCGAGCGGICAWKR